MASSARGTASGHEERYARSRERRPLELIFAGRTTAQPGEEYLRPSWDCWTFEYVTEGSGELELEHRRYAIGGGDLYVLPKGIAHRYRADRDDPWHKLYFVVDGPVVSALWHAHALHGLHRAAAFGHPDIFVRMLGLWETRPSDLHERAALALHELLLDLARSDAQATTRFSKPVTTAMDWIDRNLERSVDLDQIAEATGLSRSHFSRTFKREVGLSPYGYLVRQRIALARDWLAHTPLSVQQIAERLRYADAFYFSNAFKRHVGVAPTHYRQSLRAPSK